MFSLLITRKECRKDNSGRPDSGMRDRSLYFVRSKTYFSHLIQYPLWMWSKSKKAQSGKACILPRESILLYCWYHKVSSFLRIHTIFYSHQLGQDKRRSESKSALHRTSKICLGPYLLRQIRRLKFRCSKVARSNKKNSPAGSSCPVKACKIQSSIS